MKSKHSSDERLLALLDGELTVFGALQTRAHLRSCWECRARLARLESAAQALAEARSKSRFLTQDRIEAARDRFLSQVRAEQDARSPETGPPFRLFAASGAVMVGRRGIAFASAAMPGVAAMVTVWQSSVPATDALVVSAPVRRQVARSDPARRDPIPPAVPLEITEKRKPARTEPAGSPAATPDLTLQHETAVLWLLHEAGACRGQDIHVERAGGRIIVRGFIDTPAKRDELVAHLRELDFEVAVDLRDLTEVLQQAGTVPSQLSAPERVTRVAAAGEPLIREWLEKQNVTGAESAATRTVEIANASVRWADQAWAEAWALQDLRERFGPVWHESPDSSRIAVLSMVRDHWSELQALAARQRQILGGVLTTAPAASVDLLQAVEQWNHAVQALFAPAEPVTQPASELAARISSSLARVEAMGGDDLALAAYVRSVPRVERASTVALRPLWPPGQPGVELRCRICGRPGRFIDPFPRIPRRR